MSTACSSEALLLLFLLFPFQSPFEEAPEMMVTCKKLRPNKTTTRRRRSETVLLVGWLILLFRTLKMLLEGGGGIWSQEAILDAILHLYVSRTPNVAVNKLVSISQLLRSSCHYLLMWTSFT